MFAYVGTFTNDAAREGVHAYRFDPDTGRMTFVQHVPVRNPNYLAVSRAHNVLYAARRSGDYFGNLGEDENDVVIAYAIDPESGRLTYLNETPIPLQPAYISLDATERCLLYACSTGGAAGAIGLEADGKLTAARSVKDGPSRADLVKQGADANSGKHHTTAPHSIRPSPDNGFALAADRDRDRIRIHRLDVARGELVPHQPAWAESPPVRDPRVLERFAQRNATPHAGPRHMEFHPNGRWLYVIHEAGCIVAQYDWDSAGGALTQRGSVSTLPADFDKPNVTADIHVHPNGRFVYGSNRGHESIVVFAVNPSDGSLRLVGHEPCGGAHPRNFLIVPGGRLMLVGHLMSDTIAVFQIDAESGRLTPTGLVNDAPAPSCTVLFDPVAQR